MKSQPISDATRIRVIRAFLGEKATAFAERLGISDTTLTNWEKGRSVPGLRGCKALAKVLKSSGLVLRKDGYPVPKDV